MSSAGSARAPMPSFDEFFRALWGGREPFPWQSMLAQRVLTGAWPAIIDLPTAAGKTACIDIALYALAAQADLVHRLAPRRIWWVVDRRIVVDQAYDRARKIRHGLEAAESGPLRVVADRLKQLSETSAPLVAGRLRGGIPLDNTFASLPSQPAVIATTVDQIGSRLLFSAYGTSPGLAPIAAGLAANDSLICLDEAHLSAAFEQTLYAIEKLRTWKTDAAPLPPFAFVTLSATASARPGATVFPGVDRAAALASPVLKARSSAPKPTWLAPPSVDIAADAIDHARRFALEENRQRVAVMVNRVATAAEIADKLRITSVGALDVVLLTGRLRPLDRDVLLDRWAPHLRAEEPQPHPRPIVVVATQCLEVGADFSFDALVTECASFDALRQRLGRLNRLGAPEPAPAVLLVRADDEKRNDRDPVYGPALAATCNWLCAAAKGVGEGKRRTREMDLSTAACEELWNQLDDAARARLLPPRPPAPSLLPAHLDLLCQTEPAAAPQPEVPLYLHGVGRHDAEVQVVWRADLHEGNQGDWEGLVALARPLTQEAVAAPIWRVRQWLAATPTETDEADVEGATYPAGASERTVRPCLLWRGQGKSRIAETASDIFPGCTLVVPLAYGLDPLAQPLFPDEGQAAGQPQDLWELANLRAGRRAAALRISRPVLAPWRNSPDVARLCSLADDDGLDAGELSAALKSASRAADLPLWLRDLLAELADHPRAVPLPSGGLLVQGPQPPASDPIGDAFADDLDLLAPGNNKVTLDDHTATVAHFARKYTLLCVPALASTFAAAALWHDVGKLDPRFQLLLRNGDEADPETRPLAKSGRAPLAAGAARAELLRRCQLPAKFRHEVLSAQMAEKLAPDASGIDLELLLHLVASHHGYCRAFPPVCHDPEPPPLEGPLPPGTAVETAANLRPFATPPHRLDSGFAERFWSLNRRFGWWGLAYLEAIFRLADWAGSRWQLDGQENEA